MMTNFEVPIQKVAIVRAMTAMGIPRPRSGRKDEIAIIFYKKYGSDLIIKARNARNQN